ncbi:MAG: EAL domain-containing protein [Hyphomicrobium sp.]|jgi:diguanylate cyclase (GGDEF)-like protein
MTPRENEVGQVTRLARRIERERRARHEAESLLEAKSRELFEANEDLRQLTAVLESRVEERTSQLRDAHERAVELAEKDLLTGLANRARFSRVLSETVEECRRKHARFALVLIDLDRFKEINDLLGHEAGDKVLCDAADRFKNAVRPNDLVARIGGDEFTAIVPFLDPDANGNVAAVAKRMLTALREPVACRGRSLTVGASIGAAIFPDHGGDAEELLRNADLALYHSKASGRCTWSLFDARMCEEIHLRHRLEIDLRDALASGAFEPWLQPIIDGETGRMLGAEALVRWRRAPDQVLLPGAFLKVVEEGGLMPELFASTLRKSLEFGRKFVEAGDLEYLSVNVSPSQFRSNTLPGDVQGILKETGYAPGGLVLEITEDALITDLEQTRAQIVALTEMGVSIALDDFGSGYANIGYLRQLPIQKLKLDRTMTADVATVASSRAIVRAIAELANALGLMLIAEGIEFPSQAQALRLTGCRYLQGYLYARPMPPSAFEDYVRNARNARPGHAANARGVSLIA